MLGLDGYCVVRDFFERGTVNQVRASIENVFTQYGRSGTLEEMAFGLFRDDSEAFVACCKAAQHTLPFYRLFVGNPIIELLIWMGMETPNLNTQPLLHFSSPHVSTKTHYWKVPPHQDWPSNQGSLNGLTIWMPLVDVTPDMGPLEVIPGSHKLGSLPHHLEDGVPALVDEYTGWTPVDVRAGDLLVFSTFLVHRSGLNTSDKIRLTAATRYNDLSEKSYINRKYPRTPPLDKRLCNDWPAAEDVKSIWE